jgi:hypothetical protein
MIFIKINDNIYPATVNGKMNDNEWGNRESKSITLEMDYATAIELFVDGLKWSIIQREEVLKFDEEGNLIGKENEDTEFDNCDYFVAGSITDHRNGTITVKMGKLTQAEEFAIQLTNAVTEEELTKAYVEGVNGL